MKKKMRSLAIFRWQFSIKRVNHFHLRCESEKVNYSMNTFRLRDYKDVESERRRHCGSMHFNADSIRASLIINANTFVAKFNGD